MNGWEDKVNNDGVVGKLQHKTSSRVQDKGSGLIKRDHLFNLRLCGQCLNTINKYIGSD